VIAAAAAVAIQSFRYERTVRPAAPGIVEVLPDGALWAHARDGFADLRVVDAAGDQVPWRLADVASAHDLDVTLPVIDSGRRGALAVARVRTRAPVERLTLDVPDRRFVGVARVYGSDDRRTWTSIGSTQIYAVGGAAPGRSTAVLLRRNDFRYLEIRATSVTRIDGVTVRLERRRTDDVRVPAKLHVEHGDAVVVDVGHANVPVDELRISSTSPRYDRSFTVSSHGAVVASGRLVRLHGPGLTVVPVDLRGRFVRIEIANGDDPPLRGLRVTAYARPRPILIEGGHPRPLTLYYGGAAAAPDYEFARLPLQGAPHLARLGAERANPGYSVVDHRTLFARHRWLVTLALALGAAVLVAAGGLALRRT
jgi:hypothetical protein